MKSLSFGRKWKVRQHGISKLRTWCKIHFCIDQATFEVLGAGASTNNLSDAEALTDILPNIPGQIEQVSVGGTYDQRKCYDVLSQRRARAVIPSRKGAKIWQHANTKAERHVRYENLRRIRKVGRREWKRESNYHRRSLAETTIFRFKTIFGDRVRTRVVENQFKELSLKTAILNRITHLGMPDSYKVER
jgi:hypothetical protein